MPAPYEVTWTPSAGETCEFSLAWDMVDGTPFPWADYEIEYSLAYADGGEIFRLRQDAGGVIVNTTDGVVTFSNPDFALSAGAFEHGCRLRHRATGKVLSRFDGPVIVSESSFSSLS